MVLTPWGRSDELRSRMLDSGPRKPPEATARNQRERLYGAMVACCEERGYGATTVGDLIGLAGVSRRDFYKHFADKEACFLATLDEILAGVVSATSARLQSEGSIELRTQRGALMAFVRLVVAQPAAARLCLVEAYAAGPRAAQRVEHAMKAFQDLLARAYEGLPGLQGIPAEITGALVSGIRKMVHTRLHRGKEGELPDLVPDLLELLLSYRTPPQPLRSRRRRIAGLDGGPTSGLEQTDPGERIVRATMRVVAEKGYPATTIADIADAAGISLSTFYAHFDGKAEAFDAALYGGRTRMIGVTMPAYRRARNWPEAIRAVTQATHLFLASEPDFARVVTVDVYAAGAEALERRDVALEKAAQIPIEEGRALVPDMKETTIEAIASACYTLICDHVQVHGAETLPKLSAAATYMTLCPFIGPEQACEVANGGSYSEAPTVS